MANATDSYGAVFHGLESPLSNAVAVTPDDGADLPYVTRALHVAGSGDVRVTMNGGATVTLTGLAPGWHPLRVRRIHATGTTATGIVGGW